MSFLDRLLQGKKSAPKSTADEQAVIVRLDGSGLDDDVYASCDLATLADRLIAALQGSPLGEYDGDERTPEGAIVYLYGGDAETLFTHVEPTSRAYPLCRNAVVTIRRGGPGAPERIVTL